MEFDSPPAFREDFALQNIECQRGRRGISVGELRRRHRHLRPGGRGSSDRRLCLGCGRSGVSSREVMETSQQEEQKRKGNSHSGRLITIPRGAEYSPGCTRLARSRQEIFQIRNGRASKKPGCGNPMRSNWLDSCGGAAGS